MNLEEMKNMKLNSTIQLEDKTWIQRTPNGWIYSPPHNKYCLGVFVPEILPIIQHIEPQSKNFGSGFLKEIKE